MCCCASRRVFIASPCRRCASPNSSANACFCEGRSLKSTDRHPPTPASLNSTAPPTNWNFAMLDFPRTALRLRGDDNGWGGDMSGIPITFACGLYDRMLALYTGDVKPHGIDLNFLAIDHPREIFDRMLINLEFDACEMSSSEFIRHAVRPDCPLVAIPVFPSRVFRHGYIAIDKRQVREPKDLAGKRIGVPLYAMTAAILIRGLLQHDHGVDLSGVTWVEGGINDTKPHGAPSGIPLARKVAI